MPCATAEWVYAFRAMRRRHGIPDDDNRPFNVAYAAALQARKGKDGRGRGRGPLEDEVPLPSHDGEDERLTAAGPSHSPHWPMRSLTRNPFPVPQYLPPPSYVSGGYSNIYPVLDRDELVTPSKGLLVLLSLTILAVLSPVPT